MAIEFSFVLDASLLVPDLTKMLVTNLSLALVEGSVANTVIGDGIKSTSLSQSQLGQEIVLETFGINFATCTRLSNG